VVIRSAVLAEVAHHALGVVSWSSKTNGATTSQHGSGKCRIKRSIAQ
jgi:hypothetical protein